MAKYQDAAAIVTGAASGIGLALSKELIRRGAQVWLTDIDEASAKTAAAALGSNARASKLDVRDAVAFAGIVDRVAAEHGQLDFLFNNAGIGVGGEMLEQTVEHFDRIIDINIRGVMNGVAAAYPHMVAQRSGHIVNTASASGLLPVPLLTAYAMTKHAVVGLSRSLRLEAELYGVRVSALCPSAIETPLLDKFGPADLAQAWRPDIRGYLTSMAGPPYPVEKFASYALDAVAANKSLIVAPAMTRVANVLARWFPGLAEYRIRRAFREQLRSRPGN